MVGRAAELSLVMATIGERAAGEANTLFVSGEGGIGKTRVLTTAAGQAADEGWNVVLGRSYPVETGIPYALFSDALLPTLKGLEPGALAVLTRGGSAELAHLFPPLASPGDRDIATVGAGPSELKARLLWNFTQFLGRFSARQPLCLMLENLQWADPASLELLHFVSRQISGHSIAIIASYNDAELDANPVLRGTEQSLVNLGAAARCHIGPLLHDDIAQMVHEAFEVDSMALPQFTDRLYRSTRGNPFFVEETLKWLVESGVLQRRNGTWTGWDVESLQLPPTIRDAVAFRMQRLSRHARDVANLASVVGARISYEQLAALSPLTESSLADALDELFTRRVLEEVQGAEGPAYDFTHPILQQVMYASLGTARARLLHASVAEGLEALYGKHAVAHAGELAFHFTHSQSLAPKAVQYLREAGRTALETYANREAADFLASALEELDDTDDTDTDPDADDSGAERDEIVRNLARARQRLGDYDGALKLWEVTLGKAVATGDRARVAAIEHRMGLACYWSGRYEKALRLYADALLDADVADREVIVRVHLARGICLQDLGRLDEAKAEVESALAAAEAAGSKRQLARAHRALLLLYAWTGPADVALAHGERAVTLAGKTGDLMLEWTAHWGMGVLAGLTGNAGAVIHHVTESERRAAQLRSPLLGLLTAELSLQYASGTGDWDAGLATGERSVALARSLKQRTLLPRLLVWTGLIHLWRDDHERAKSYFDEAWTLAGAGSGYEGRVDVPTVVPTFMGLAAYHLETGNHAEAIRIGEAGMEIADRSGYIAWSLQYLLPVVGEAALWTRDWDRADRHLARMRRDASRLGNRLGMAMADSCDGMLLYLRDRNAADAIPLLRAGIERLEAIPYPDIAARVRRILAWAMRDSEDKDGALRELRTAHDVCARLGAQRTLTGIRNDMRKLGARPPARTAGSGAAGLTGRETEIVRMVAKRKSNKQIGSALDISPRTVSTHMSNIFSKLGVGSRGELADFAKAHSLQ